MSLSGYDKWGYSLKILPGALQFGTNAGRDGQHYFWYNWKFCFCFLEFLLQLHFRLFSLFYPICLLCRLAITLKLRFSSTTTAVGNCNTSPFYLSDTTRTSESGHKRRVPTTEPSTVKLFLRFQLPPSRLRQNNMVHSGPHEYPATGHLVAEMATYSPIPFFLFFWVGYRDGAAPRRYNAQENFIEIGRSLWIRWLMSL